MLARYAILRCVALLSCVSCSFLVVREDIEMRSSWKTILHLLAYVLQGVAALLVCFVIVVWLLRAWKIEIPEIIPDAALEPLSIILGAVVSMAAGRVAAWSADRLPQAQSTPVPSPKPKPPAVQAPQPGPKKGSTAHPAAYSCFISYSTKDETFVQQLAARLESAGLNVWYANDDIRAGVKLYDQITEAIQRQDKLMIVLSEHSMASEWVTTEIRLGRRAEISTAQRKLFPIRLVDMPMLLGWEAFDADVGKDLAVEVREYFIPDFSNWQDPVAFEAGVTRLLENLQVTA